MKHLSIKNALVSVSDKSKLDLLIKCLDKWNVNIISTGGTGKYINSLGVDVIPVEEINNSPEAFDGRVKTLGSNIFGGILFDRSKEQHLIQSKELNIPQIDLVVCNLYPFEEVIKNDKTTDSDLIENIDIGGVSLIRAAAKNFDGVALLTESSDYMSFIEEFEALEGNISFEFRKNMAIKGFERTYHYDQAIYLSLSSQFKKSSLNLISPKLGDSLRYGENPHQEAKLISFKKGLSNAFILHGKEMSYNNYLDSDAAVSVVKDLNQLNNTKNSISIIKHSNPCGLACGENQLETLKKAWEGDSVSAFGSVICFSKEVNLSSAEYLSKLFVEVILAPSFSKEAFDLLSQKKNIRLVKVDLNSAIHQNIRSIDGGLLIQDSDSFNKVSYQTVTNNGFDYDTSDLISFGTIASKALKSNAICLVKKEGDLYYQVGAGMGNPNRLVSTKQAIDKAKENGIDSFEKLICISDAFFPFKDNIELLNKYNIKYVVQPGGSIRDDEVIQACNDFNIAMAFTGKRHFNH